MFGPSGWEPLFDAADRMMLEKRLKNQFTQQYNELVNQYNALLENYNQLHQKYKQITEKYNSLYAVYTKMLDENDQMYTWAREMALSFRAHYIRVLGEGRPVNEIPLEVRRDINRRLLAVVTTLYDGFALPHSLMKKYLPEILRISESLRLSKVLAKKKPEKAKMYAERLEREWQALPESVSMLGKAMVRQLGHHVTGEGFRNKIQYNHGDVEDLVYEGMIATRPDSARYYWTYKPYAEASCEYEQEKMEADGSTAEAVRQLMEENYLGIETLQVG